MASEDCVASCASTLSSAGKSADKILILDYRGGVGGFNRVQLDLDVEDTFSKVFERAQLVPPIDPENSCITVTVEQTQITLQPHQFDTKLSDLVSPGTVKICIKTLNAVSPQTTVLPLPVEGKEFGVDDDDDAMVIEQAPPAPEAPEAPEPPEPSPEAIPRMSVTPADIAAAAAEKAQKRDSSAMYHMEEALEKKRSEELGKVIVAAQTESKDGNACSNEDTGISSYDCRSKTGFAGLNNQGATCYMNSLIQSLYMNPEFRRMVYDWSFEDHYQTLLKRKRERNPDMTAEQEAEFRKEKEKNSIPLQLQNLFAMMQLTPLRACSTKKLTTSFAWDAADAFTQHDVTELRAVLFEALEKAMAGTTQATAIKDLFEGEVLEYVRCLGCQHENVKSVPLYEVLLDIKVFGETKAVESVEEAMKKFITPEVLDEDNLYHCEACGNKCRAVKGARFKRFPYFLVMQMKRFDFDFVTMDRVKLCDRVTFPYEFDAADYLEGGKIDTELMSKAVSGKKDDKEEKDDEMGEGAAADSATEETTTTTTTTEEDGAAKPMEVEKKSDEMYDLYAVLIHSGGANGGHYYAYIKDYRSGKWFQFNDSSVSEISDADIQNVFGKDSTTTSTGYSYYKSNSYGTTAYMLMYRKIDPARNMLPCTDEEVPENLRKYVEEENKAEVEKKMKEKLERETCHLRIKYKDVEKKFSKHESATVGELKEEVLKAFECDVNPEDTRLVLVDTYAKKETSLLDTARLKDCDINSWNRDMILETKKPGEEWVVKNPNAITLHIFCLEQPKEDETTKPEEGEPKEGETKPEESEPKEGETTKPEESEPKDVFSLCDMKFTSFDVYVDKNQRVLELRKLISEKTGIDLKNLRMLKKSSNSYDKTETLSDDTESLFYAYLSADDQIYVEKCEDGIVKATAETSRIFCYLENIRNMSTYRVKAQGFEDFEIVFDQRRPLKDLKAFIAQRTGIPLETLILKRGSENWKTEMKDLEKTLKENYLYSNDTVFVEEGISGSHNVRIFLWRPETNEAELLFRVKAIETELVRDFLNRVISKYVELDNSCGKYPKSDNPLCYALREYSYEGYFPGGFYNPAVTVKSSVSWIGEDSKFLFQVLPEPLTLPEDPQSLRIFCYEWHPESLSVDPVAKEILVNKTQPFNDIRRSLVAVHRPYVPESKEEEEVKKEEDKPKEEAAASTEKKTTEIPEDVTKMEEDKPKEEAAATTEEKPADAPEEATKKEEVVEDLAVTEFLPENVCICMLSTYGKIRVPSRSIMMAQTNEAPSWEQGETLTLLAMRDLYLRSGYSIVFWNGAVKQKELSEAEKARMTRVEASQGTTYNWNNTSYSSGYSNYTASAWHRKETGIKIHVDEDSDDEAETKTTATEGETKTEATEAETKTEATEAETKTEATEAKTKTEATEDDTKMAE